MSGAGPWSFEILSQHSFSVEPAKVRHPPKPQASVPWEGAPCCDRGHHRESEAFFFFF